MMSTVLNKIILFDINQKNISLESILWNLGLIYKFPSKI